METTIKAPPTLNNCKLLLVIIICFYIRVFVKSTETVCENCCFRAKSVFKLSKGILGYKIDRANIYSYYYYFDVEIKIVIIICIRFLTK